MEASYRVWSVRGAVSLDVANKEQMVSRVDELLSKLIEKNNIEGDDIVNIQFTQTEDIDFLNAALAARSGSKGEIVSTVPLFCSLEPRYPQSLKHTIRIMISYYHNHQHCPEPVYLYKAGTLRRDLSNA